MKKLTITIKNNVTGQVDQFDTNGMIGAFINRELGGGNSDTSQFKIGDVEGKELIKLLAGCINMTYHTVEDETVAEQIIRMATEVARQGYKLKNPYREGY